MTNMTDDELREAISTAREEKPTYIPDINHCLFEPLYSENRAWYCLAIYSEGDKVYWKSVNWLSWEYAGILLEEAGLTLVKGGVYWCGKIDEPSRRNHYSQMCIDLDFLFSCNSTRPTRAIAEAYLEWKTK